MLGQNLGSRVLLPVQKSVFKGMPVEYVSSGSEELMFAVNDISMSSSSPSSITSNISPLLFQRYYSSVNSEDTGLGRGWRFLYEEKVSVAGAGRATLTNSFGEKFEYVVGKKSMLDEKTAGGHLSFRLYSRWLGKAFSLRVRTRLVWRPRLIRKHIRSLAQTFI